MKTAWVSLSLNGRPFGVVTSMEGREAVSTDFSYELEVEIAGTLAVDAPVGAEAVIDLGNAFGARQVTGVVAEASSMRSGADSTRVVLTVRPVTARLAVGRDCWCKQDSTVVQALEEVLADLSPRLQLRSSYAEAPYRVQYREDDWAYARRLMEADGIHFYFDHASGSRLVLGDHSPSAPPIEGETEIPWRPAQGLLEDREGIWQVGLSASTAPGKFTVKSFDPSRPRLDVSGQAGSSGIEVYDAPGGGPVDPGEASRRAKLGAETARAGRRILEGGSNSVRLVPGSWFQLTDHRRFDGAWWITEARVSLRGPGQPIECRFAAIPLVVPYRPPARTPEAKQAGLQMGVVGGAPGTEVHPDPSGRVRTQLHWDRIGDRTDKAGTWMRVAQRCTPGSMLLPRIGWNVATFNEEGGVDAPSLLCRIHDGEHRPTYDLPGRKTRVVYKTATTPGGGTFNEMYFEDAKGAEEMFINASRDMNVVVQHKKVEKVLNDHRRKVGNIHDLTVSDLYTESIGDDQTRTIGADQKIDVGASRTETVTLNDTITIGGTRKVTCGDSHNLAVSKDRTVSVGPAILDLTLGDVSCAGKDGAMLVGGVAVRVSGDTVATSTDIGVQLIGGARIEIAARDRNMTVGKSLRELVGGAIKVASGGVYTDTCDKVSKWKAAASFEGKSKEILLEAGETIRLKCGESVLTVTKDKIEISATELKLSGAKITAKTGKIQHNP